MRQIPTALVKHRPTGGILGRMNPVMVDAPFFTIPVMEMEPWELSPVGSLSERQPIRHEQHTFEIEGFTSRRLEIGDGSIPCEREMLKEPETMEDIPYFHYNVLVVDRLEQTKYLPEFQPMDLFEQTMNQPGMLTREQERQNEAERRAQARAKPVTDVERAQWKKRMDENLKVKNQALDVAAAHESAFEQMKETLSALIEAVPVGIIPDQVLEDVRARGLMDEERMQRVANPERKINRSIEL